MDKLVQAFFVFASLTLMLVATGLVAYGPILIAIRLLEGEGDVGSAVLDGLGFMILALAVFDVAKYLYDEEVKRGREMRQAAETRRSLTKFITIVIIAVLMDSLVNVSKAASIDQSQLLYPSALIIAGVALLVGLGVFMRLSATTEEKVGLADEADQAAEVAEDAKAAAKSEAKSAKGSAQHAEVKAHEADDAAEKARAAAVAAH